MLLSFCSDSYFRKRLLRRNRRRGLYCSYRSPDVAKQRTIVLAWPLLCVTIFNVSQQRAVCMQSDLGCQAAIALGFSTNDERKGRERAVAQGKMGYS